MSKRGARHADGAIRCPACGEASDVCYRCSECGHDLASTDSTEGRQNV